MRQKSDRKKLEEGRCLGEGREYVGFLKANEAKSIGTASEIWDPIEKRTGGCVVTERENIVLVSALQ